MLLTHELFPVLNWDLAVNYNKIELILALTLPLVEIGGTKGYPHWFRLRVLVHAANHGIEDDANSWGCCVNSIKNWQDRPIPYRMTGGAEKEALTGYDQLLLVICLYIYPNTLCSPGKEVKSQILPV